jgi:hypothetical protein
MGCPKAAIQVNAKRGGAFATMGCPKAAVIQINAKRSGVFSAMGCPKAAIQVNAKQAVPSRRWVARRRQGNDKRQH